MNIVVKNSEEHGPYLTTNDWETADHLDDYFSEKEFILYNRSSSKSDSGEEIFKFWFGRAASDLKVRELIERFKLSI